MVGPFKDIPAPDMNTDSRHMAWFFDEYTKFEGFSPGVVTGKPIWLHGSLGRESATGRGTVFGIENMLTHFGDGEKENKVEGKTFAIQVRGLLGSGPGLSCCQQATCAGYARRITLRSQRRRWRRDWAAGLWLVGGKALIQTPSAVMQGFGNVGAWTARLLSERGGIIRAVSDASGCVLDESPQGIDVTKLLRHMHRGDALPHYPHGQQLLRDEIFDVPCDVMVPAALGGVVNGARPLLCSLAATRETSLAGERAAGDTRRIGTLCRLRGEKGAVPVYCRGGKWPNHPHRGPNLARPRHLRAAGHLHQRGRRHSQLF